jgi:hypothetical protein
LRQIQLIVIIVIVVVNVVAAVLHIRLISPLLAPATPPLTLMPPLFVLLSREYAGDPLLYLLVGVLRRLIEP